MYYSRIIKILVIITLIPVSSLAQGDSFKENYVAYRMIKPVDSVFTLVLDSLNSSTIESLVVEVFTDMCYDNNVKYFLYLNYIPFLKEDTIGYTSFLARNSSHYYLSNNKKYKIPIAFDDDLNYLFDWKKYPARLLEDEMIGFVYLTVDWFDRLLYFHCKIPSWALKIEYQ